MEKLDCVVIGAGWYGLAAAKQYHVQHPGAPMAVLDSSPTLGGVWAEHRLYPGLHSNNMKGTLEYPDFPMEESKFGVKAGQHLPGTAIHAYHIAYAKHFGFFDLIRTKTKVVSAEHQADGGWVLTVLRDFDVLQPHLALPQTKLFAQRLVVATGLTSEPFLPRIEGQEDFGAPLFHARDFLQNAHTIDPDESRRVTVLGGTKFAWDAVYAYATKGVKVDWVIRGKSPGMSRLPSIGPWNLLDGASVRDALEEMVREARHPCVWAQDAGFLGMRSFWHGTWIGRAITNTFWNILGGDVISLNKFDSHPETAKLKPWTQAFFTGCSFSILNYETDFFELVRSGAVKVHVADISHLSSHKVHLADEDKTVLDSDALVLVTGWKHIPPLQFLPEGIDKELGVPHLPAAESSPTDLASHQSLFDKADDEILSRFPRLKDPGVFNENYIPLSDQKGVSIEGKDTITPTTPLTPFLLYHFLVPAQKRFLKTRDTAFVGFSMNFSNAMTAHLEGLWVSAYFDDKLARDPAAKPLEEVQYETVLHNRMGKWRYPYDYGCKYPDFVFDAVPYMDLLLADMGLRVRRKKSWWAEITEPYGIEDYRNVNEEWDDKFGKK